MEKIEIKDFLGIKDISIEVKQINILIGPQASGKSVIAKLLYYFKDFVSKIFFAAIEEAHKRDFDKLCLQKFEYYFPSSSWGNSYFKIKYYLDNEFIEVQRKSENSNTVTLKYSEFYLDNLKELRVFIKEHKNQDPDNNYQIRLSNQLKFSKVLLNAFLNDISQELDNKLVSFNQLYIPAGRSFFSNIKSSIFAFLSENSPIDPFLIEFGNYYENIKNYEIRNLQNNHAFIKQGIYNEINLLNNQVLCGKYMQVDGEDYIQLDDNRLVSVNNSSSGQQETLPLSIIMKNIAFSNSKEGGDSIYIEEPEAHIFPTAQKNIVELISTVYNARENSLQFFITTHSPYILTAFNNLLQAGILAIDATEEKIKEINKLVPKTRFLHPKELAVYSLENGYCQSIVDQETGLIDANIIDEVSSELAVQFDQLLDLEE